MYRLSRNDDYILLIVYVDDLLYIGSNDGITTWFEGELQQDLTLTVSSTVTQYLGLNIREEEDAIYINAAKYADTIAKRFAITPTAISTPYRYATGKEGFVLLKPAGIRNYQKKLGCLLFASVTCRPDLSYSASQLATYLKRPETEHLAELDRALHYFVSTSMIGLTYYKGATTPTELVGYVDADHAGDSDNRRSRTGYIYRLESIGPISWQSSKQELIALSSAEAEYIALCSATKEGLYLRELLEEAKLADEQSGVNHPRASPSPHPTTSSHSGNRGGGIQGAAVTGSGASRQRDAGRCRRRDAGRRGDCSGRATVRATSVGAATPDLQKLVCYADVVMSCHENGWIDANGVIQWLEECVKPFLKPGFMRHARSSMVVLDSYRGHLTDVVKEKFRELNCVPAIIPSGCTAEVQPLDVSINKSFKASVRQQYQKWFQEEGQEQLTKAVPADLIKRAFLTCGISNALDGSEDCLAMAHRRSQLTAEVDVDDSIIADGFFGNNCQEPESDEEE
ncbi:unnamed protein product [Closterium sp. NIES-54]